MSDAASDVADSRKPRPVLDRISRFQGRKWSLVTDRVRLDDDLVVQRDIVVHPGAVAIVALDENEDVVLVRQYRHAVQSDLWELPAGLLDEPGEPPVEAAQRELFEEAHLRAESWDLVLDVYSSAGMSSEVVRIYLARGLRDVPNAERHVQVDEERDMASSRIGLDQACELAMTGHLHNSVSIVGLMAVARSRTLGWVDLRPATEPLHRPHIDD